MKFYRVRIMAKKVDACVYEGKNIGMFAIFS